MSYVSLHHLMQFFAEELGHPGLDKDSQGRYGLLVDDDKKQVWFTPAGNRLYIHAQLPLLPANDSLIQQVTIRLLGLSNAYLHEIRESLTLQPDSDPTRPWQLELHRELVIGAFGLKDLMVAADEFVNTLNMMTKVIAEATPTHTTPRPLMHPFNREFNRA